MKREKKKCEVSFDPLVHCRFPYFIQFSLQRNSHVLIVTTSPKSLQIRIESAGQDIVNMETSRIFVRGLPPTITDDELRRHFSAGNREVTDVKAIPQRRIGYIGFKTPQDAEKAVKYFHRSFIRMSRLFVELARPVCSPNASSRLLARY